VFFTGLLVVFQLVRNHFAKNVSIHFLRSFILFMKRFFYSYGEHFYTYVIHIHLQGPESAVSRSLTAVDCRRNLSHNPLLLSQLQSITAPWSVSN